MPLVAAGNAAICEWIPNPVLAGQIVEAQTEECHITDMAQQVNR